MVVVEDFVTDTRLRDRPRVNRHEHVRGRAGLGAEKPRGRDADDFERLVIDSNRLADCRRGFAEAAPAVRLGEHDDRRGSGLIVRLVEQPAGRRRDAHAMEIVAGDVVPLHRIGGHARRDAQPLDCEVAERACEDVAAVLKHAQRRIRKDAARRALPFLERRASRGPRHAPRREGVLPGTPLHDDERFRFMNRK